MYISKAWVMALCFMTFLLLPFAAEAQYTNGQFEQILADVVKSSPSNKVETDDGAVPIVGGIQAEGSGAWVVSISYAFHVSEYTVQVVSYPGDLKFDGNKIEYSFEGPTIYFDPPDQVFQEKGFQKAAKSWMGKYKDLNMVVKLDDDRVVVTAAGDVAGLNQGKVAERLKALFVASNGVMWWSEVTEKKVKEKYIKDLVKKKLDYMKPMDFEELATVYEEVERGGVKEGAYDMSHVSYVGRRTGLNYGDRVVLEFRPGAGMLSNDERAALVPTVEKWLKKNKLKKAETAVQVSDGDPNFIVVSATVNMDGKIKGKDFQKVVEEFRYEWTGNLQHYAVYEPGIKPKRSMFTQTTPQSLDNQQLYLMLDDLEMWRREGPEGSKGHWVLVYQELLDTETRQYLTNYGDRLVLVYGKPVKDGSKAQEVLQRAKVWVAGNQAPNASSAEVALMDGDPSELRLTATIPVGQLTADELSKAYYLFRSTYSGELDTALNEILEIY